MTDIGGLEAQRNVGDNLDAARVKPVAQPIGRTVFDGLRTAYRHLTTPMPYDASFGLMAQAGIHDIAQHDGMGAQLAAVDQYVQSSVERQGPA